MSRDSERADFSAPIRVRTGVDLSRPPPPAKPEDLWFRDHLNSRFIVNESDKLKTAEEAAACFPVMYDVFRAGVAASEFVRSETTTPVEAATR